MILTFTESTYSTIQCQGVLTFPEQLYSNGLQASQASRRRKMSASTLQHQQSLYVRLSNFRSPPHNSVYLTDYSYKRLNRRGVSYEFFEARESTTLMEGTESPLNLQQSECVDNKVYKQKMSTNLQNNTHTKNTVTEKLNESKKCVAKSRGQIFSYFKERINSSLSQVN